MLCWSTRGGEDQRGEVYSSHTGQGISQVHVIVVLENVWELHMCCIGTYVTFMI